MDPHIIFDESSVTNFDVNGTLRGLFETIDKNDKSDEELKLIIFSEFENGIVDGISKGGEDGLGAASVFCLCRLDYVKYILDRNPTINIASIVTMSIASNRCDIVKLLADRGLDVSLLFNDVHSCIYPQGIIALKQQIIETDSKKSMTLQDICYNIILEHKLDTSNIPKYIMPQ